MVPYKHNRSNADKDGLLGQWRRRSNRPLRRDPLNLLITLIIYSLMDFRILNCTKNRFRNHHLFPNKRIQKRMNSFCLSMIYISKNFKLDFFQTNFCSFQNLKCYNSGRIELLGRFFFEMLVFISSMVPYRYIQIDFSGYVHGFSDYLAYYGNIPHEA